MGDPKFLFSLFLIWGLCDYFKLPEHPREVRCLSITFNSFVYTDAQIDNFLCPLRVKSLHTGSDNRVFQVTLRRAAADSSVGIGLGKGGFRNLSTCRRLLHHCFITSVLLKLPVLQCSDDGKSEAGLGQV